MKHSAFYAGSTALGWYACEFGLMSPMTVSRISRYDIKSLIGAGGMGTVYLARDSNPNTNRLVAIKLLNANLDSPTFASASPAKPGRLPR